MVVPLNIALHIADSIECIEAQSRKKKPYKNSE